jgi:hypothetical protein
MCHFLFTEYSAFYVGLTRGQGDVSRYGRSTRLLCKPPTHPTAGKFRIWLSFAMIGFTYTELFIYCARLHIDT